MSKIAITTSNFFNSMDHGKIAYYDQETQNHKEMCVGKTQV